ncbi:4Fe-4S binding protein [uncultured Clostridium sp.]
MRFLVVQFIIKWDGRCEQCMACIQYCPKEAIQF